MARLLSNMVIRGMSSSSNNAKVAIAASCMKHMKYSTNGFSTSGYETKITSDPETHEDFQPTNRSSGISLLDIVQQDVKENPVMIYMKGLPDAPRCGFSALAVKVLQQNGVPIRARDILGDLKLKESVKSYTNWPTFPQIFIKGEFVGGSDIVLNMHQKGELQELLADLKHDDNQRRESEDSSSISPTAANAVSAVNSSKG